MSKRLDDVYSADELEFVRNDLMGVVDEVVTWLEGGEVDPDLLGYMNLFFMSMAQRFPQDADDWLKEVKEHKTEPYKLNITLPESFKKLNNLAKKMESLPQVEFSKKEIVIEKETPSAQFSSDIFERW